MRTVYAIRFDINPKEKPIHLIVEEIKSILAEWVRRKYKVCWRMDFNIPYEHKIYTPIKDHEITAYHVKTDGIEKVVLDWTHPDDKDNTIRWKTTYILSSDGTLIEATAIVRVFSAQYTLQPLGYYKAGRPRFLREILKM